MTIPDIQEGGPVLDRHQHRLLFSGSGPFKQLRISEPPKGMVELTKNAPRTMF